ncbi:MAG: hypothetical protein CMJ46_01335 [Planctomyces sp.]|nr:hypothetical protein [Planctomyces sp.]
MPNFTRQHFDQVATQAQAQVETIASGLKQCFDHTYTVEVGEAVPLPPAPERAGLDEPGLMVGIRVGDSGAIVILPESFPLPKWYRTPDESQKSRLGTLGMEWSIALFPEELMAEEFSSYAFEDLNSGVDATEPVADAQWIPLKVTKEGAAAPFTLYIAGPMMTPCFNPALAAEAEKQEATEQAGMESASYADPSGSMSEEERRARMMRIMNLRVDVSVRLAEKRIELSQLVAMAPGSLILFEKSCEELLDMYVNDVPYCRGEVVKVGEHFGLKVNEVGYHIERRPRII